MELALFFRIIIANAHKLRNSEDVRRAENVARVFEEISLVELLVVVQHSHKRRKVTACTVAQNSDSLRVNVVLVCVCTKPPDCELAVLDGKRELRERSMTVLDAGNYIAVLGEPHSLLYPVIFGSHHESAAGDEHD